MKIALVQLDYHIGNFFENTTQLVMEIKKAQQNNVDLVIFSELSVCGYPPLDLLERKEFILSCETEIKRIARISTDIGVIIGGPSVNPGKEGKLLFNTAFFLYEGKIKQKFHKTLLPTYDIFDEYRYFEPNREFSLLEFRGIKIAVTICEDLWDEQPVEHDFARSRLYTLNPMEELSRQNPGLIVNIAASPFSHTRTGLKKAVFINKAKKYKIPVIYVNQTGGQAQLIFEGGSMAIDASGRVVEQLNYFTPDTRVVEFAQLTGDFSPKVFEEPDRIKMIHDALITGIRSYFNKLGFRKAVLGLSGGIDSAVSVVLAVRALGNENVHVLLLPSQYSSDHSIGDSVELADNTGISYDIINIREAFDTFIKLLAPVFKDIPEDITEENIQSRIRGLLLMAYSNKFGHILLNTSNKSEAAVGYGTLYGDMAGGLSVLGDVYKTDIYRLAKFINRKKVIIPENILIKPPSAELRPDQKDTDSLPDYDVLDKILEEYIEHHKSLTELKEMGYNEELAGRVIRMIVTNEYKRYQSPPALRISSKAFGIGRRIPLTSKF